MYSILITVTFLFSDKQKFCFLPTPEDHLDPYLRVPSVLFALNGINKINSNNSLKPTHL